ncbi:hypothetical protein [Sorangium cellulosum]|uniref:Uncharacterized protein n=1 Tax=Sorangium cellulosum TaxID=56 RepID=A0A150Q2J2_SORCE|nr:hypothetical protein [Sorangium cellulosum]KYF62225.1 hypothetical protein BE15_06315 [Sorangium cellulosum]
MAINEADEIFVTGTTDGTIDFGGGTLPGGHVLVKLDAAGEYIFSRSIRFGHRIVIDPAGDLVVAGRGLATLDASGTELWSINFDADVQDVSLSPTGTIAVTGGARGPVDFWSGPIAFGGGSSDAYVATFNPPACPAPSSRVTPAPTGPGASAAALPVRRRVSPTVPGMVPASAR